MIYNSEIRAYNYDGFINSHPKNIIFHEKVCFCSQENVYVECFFFDVLKYSLSLALANVTAFGS